MFTLCIKIYLESRWTVNNNLGSVSQRAASFMLTFGGDNLNRNRFLVGCKNRSRTNLQGGGTVGNDLGGVAQGAASLVLTLRGYYLKRNWFIIWRLTEFAKDSRCVLINLK